MKNISPYSLPHFHGLTSEDPDTFLFKFFSYEELMITPLMTEKLKLFLFTLKDATLCLFMGLPRDSITTQA